jgi:hypothetical protein
MSLYNPGFLGEHFKWWIGQIADDSTWRDNILPGKFESKNQVPGHGYRYKVRIIGLHDQGETEIPSDQLPWAQVMYPVTGGGGQANAGATANLRQGMFVFGFFLDGMDQQVPVIMGVLGNNIQTKLAPTIGDNKVTNNNPGSLAVSGNANSAKGNTDPFRKVPDKGLDIQGSSETKPTVETVTGVHKVTKADVVRNDYYQKKTVLMSPCEHVKSALKAIQTELDNLVKEIDKVLNAAQSYIDAVSNFISSIQDLIADFACKIAKYMKIVFNKIKEYVLKTINKALSPTIDTLPPNLRYTYFDVKSSITELINCLYAKITNNLCGLIQSILNGQIEQSLPKDKRLRSPKPQICAAEKLTGDLIALNMNEMNTGVNGILDNINNFLNDIQSQLGVVSGGIGAVKDIIGGVSGSITSALSFENIKLNVFGCDLKPNCATSDYYTLQNGSGAAEDPQQPRPSEVDKAAQGTPPTDKATEKPYAQPSRNQPDVINSINQATQFIRSI